MLRPVRTGLVGALSLVLVLAGVPPVARAATMTSAAMGDIDLVAAGRVTPMSQHDAHWAGLPIGPTAFSMLHPTTIGDCGCLVTAMSMVVDSVLSAALPWYAVSGTRTNASGGTDTWETLEFNPAYLNEYLSYGPHAPDSPDQGFNGYGLKKMGRKGSCGTFIQPWALEKVGVPLIQGGPFGTPSGISFRVIPEARGGFGHDVGAWELIDANLAKGIPSIVGLEFDGSTSGSHAVLIDGWDPVHDTYRILDPWASTPRTEDAPGGTRATSYADFIDHIVAVWVADPFVPGVSPGAVLVIRDDPASIRFLLADPQGRRTGWDPVTGTWRHEIPTGSYDRALADSDALGQLQPLGPVESLSVDGVPDGTYSLTVEGTGSGDYSFDVFMVNDGVESSYRTFTGTATPGSAIRYEIAVRSGSVSSVTPVDGFYPKAVAGVDQSTSVGRPVTVDGSQSSVVEPGVSIVDWGWDFGDASTAIGGMSATHAYGAPGDYAVTLTVTDSAGRHSTDSLTIHVLPEGSAYRTTTLVDTGSDGNNGATWAVLSRDGTVAAFSSMEGFSALGVPSGVSFNLFTRDLRTGVTEVLVPGTYLGEGPRVRAISGDGRYVGFASLQPLLPSVPTTNVGHSYVIDRQTRTLELVDVYPDGTPCQPTMSSSYYMASYGAMSFSSDGRYVAFDSACGRLAGGDALDANPSHAYVRDRLLGATERIDVPSSGVVVTDPRCAMDEAYGYGPRISADGRYVVFSGANGLVAGRRYCTRAVFLRDRIAGTTEMVSLLDGVEPTPRYSDDDSWGGDVSNDGRFVVFASNLRAFNPARPMTSPENERSSVLLYDRTTRITTLVSRPVNGTSESGSSISARIGGDARFVSWVSNSTNLVAGDSSAAFWKVFLLDRLTGATTVESVAADGTPAPDGSGVFCYSNMSNSCFVPIRGLADAGGILFGSDSRWLDPSQPAWHYENTYLRNVVWGSGPSTPGANLSGPYVTFASTVARPTALSLDATGSVDPGGAPLTALFDPGDGSGAQTPTGLVLTHSYAAVGTATATATVSNGSRVSLPAATTVEVLVPPGSDAIATGVGCADPGGPVTIDGTAVASNGQLLAHGWDRSRGPVVTEPAVVTLSWDPGHPVSAPTAFPGLGFTMTVTAPASPGSYSVTLAGDASARLTVPCPPPLIRPIARPNAPINVVVGTAVRLDGTASSDPQGERLEYSWEFGDGATSDSPQPTHPYEFTGTYWVGLAVKAGGRTSTVAWTTVTVLPVATGAAPAITLHPTSQTVCGGGPASFTAGASGSPAPTVQWQVSTDDGSTWADVAGATTTTLTFTASAADQSSQYRATFANTAGSVASDVATLTVDTAPIVSTDPTDLTVDAGGSASFTAAATGSPTPTVRWQVSTDGGSSWTDVDGVTTTTLTFTASGSDNGRQYRAVFSGSCGTATTTAAMLAVRQPTQKPTSLAFDATSPVGGHVNDRATLRVRLLGPDGIPVPGQSVTIDLGGQSCLAGPTDASGLGSCAIAPTGPADVYSLSAAYAGDDRFLPSSTAVGSTFTASLEETSLTLIDPPAFIADGGSVTLSAVLVDPADQAEAEPTATAIDGKEILFLLGNGATAQTCSGRTDAGGRATCVLAAVSQPAGPRRLSASFAGDAFNTPSTAVATVAPVAFAYLSRGSFIIGDRSAVVGARVTWWGSTWSASNILSGGRAPSAFKGFASSLTPFPPGVGGTWSTTGGASASPPASVPAYMAVVVTGKVLKSGSTIFSGATTRIGILRVGPGYGPLPGETGTGTLVGFLP
jgi:PKD repeat protein